MTKPPRWSEDELDVEATEAIRLFRETRMQEPLEAYLDFFDEYRQHVENLIEGTVDAAPARTRAATPRCGPRSRPG